MHAAANLNPRAAAPLISPNTVGSPISLIDGVSFGLMRFAACQLVDTAIEKSSRWEAFVRSSC